MVTAATDVDATISDLIARLERNGIRVEAAILYGSHASGNPHEWSDIDVAIVSPDFEGMPLWERQRIVSRATLGRHPDLAPIAYPCSEYRNPGPHSFLGEIIRTGRIVYQARGK
jgi:stress-induced morphogen